MPCVLVHFILIPKFIQWQRMSCEGNRHIVRTFKDAPEGQMFLFNDLQPFTLCPDSDRINNVILKNARGHVYHELGEPIMEDPANMFFRAPHVYN